MFLAWGEKEGREVHRIPILGVFSWTSLLKTNVKRKWKILNDNNWLLLSLPPLSSPFMNLRYANTSPIGEPNAKNLDTSKSNMAWSTESTDRDMLSKLNVCSLAALLKRCGETKTLSSISSTGGERIISSVSGSTFSRMFPLLRLSRRLCEFSKLLLGGVWLLIRRGFFATLPFVSALFTVFGDSIAVLEMKLCVRFCKVFSLVERAS